MRRHTHTRHNLRGAAVYLACAALAALAVACSAGYQGRVLAINDALAQNDPAQALLLADQALAQAEARGDEEDDDPLQSDVPLLLLERATLLQANGDHEGAVRDFAAADQTLEVLDLSASDSADVGKYLFSDDATLYQAPPHEKLLLNTLAMISWLCLDDLEGARVEARRLAVLQKYLQDAAPEERSLFGLGSWIAGFSFEMSGQLDEALNFYLEAWRSHGFDAAKEPIARLANATGRRDDDIDAIQQELGTLPALPDDHGTLLVVVQTGRAPFKVAERVPIGAFTTLQVSDSRYNLTPEERERANQAALEGALKWINFPALVDPDDLYQHIEVRLDGRDPGEPAVRLDVAAATRAAWAEDQPRLMISALTRMLTRALAGNVTQALTSSAVKGSTGNKAGGNIAGLLLGLAVEGALAAQDTPDTRSWNSLPSDIRVFRLSLPPGQHTLSLTASQPGKTRRAQKVDVPPGGFAVLNLRLLR